MVFNFFYQCLIVFQVQVFYLLRFIPRYFIHFHVIVIGMEPSSEVGDCGAGVPDLVSACWWSGSILDMDDCRVCGLPKLVLAHW